MRCNEKRIATICVPVIAIAASVCHAQQPGPMPWEANTPIVDVRKGLFIKAPRAGVSVRASTFYTWPSGVDMMCVMSTQSRSDTADTLARRFSSE